LSICRSLERNYHRSADLCENLAGAESDFKWISWLALVATQCASKSLN
jgi:hypothetical protein